MAPNADICALHVNNANQESQKHCLPTWVPKK